MAEFCNVIVPAHGRLEMAQTQFDAPAPGVEGDQLPGRVEGGIQQGGHQGDAAVAEPPQVAVETIMRTVTVRQEGPLGAGKDFDCWIPLCRQSSRRCSSDAGCGSPFPA